MMQTNRLKKRLIFSSALISALLGACVFPRAVNAQDPLVKPDVNIGIKWDFMQIVNSSNAHELTAGDSTWLNGMWMQSLKSILDIKTTLGSHLDLRITYYGLVQFTAPENPANTKVQSYRGGGGIDEASVRWRFGDADSLSAGFKIGYFPMEYTHSWQRLGSYLYRSGVYPGYIISPLVPNAIGGAQVFYPGKILSHNLIASLELDYFPKNDLTLTYMGRASLNSLTIDAAVMFHRILRNDQSHYFYSQTYPRFLIEDYTEEEWDDTKGAHYRKAGIKLMARATWDGKSVFQNSNFGPNDLTFYAEAAVLGLANFPGFYNKISERIPVMAGCVFPTFGFLDAFGAEIEWYGSRWKNDPGLLAFAIPVESYEPRSDGAGFEFIEVGDAEEQDGGEKAIRNNLKWAVFAERSLSERLILSAHVASDHFRAPSGNSYQPDEVLHGPREWYWQVSLKTTF